MVHWQFLMTYIFSVSPKFGTCCMTGQWGVLRMKNATLTVHIVFWNFFIFHQKNCVFIIFISFFDGEVAILSQSKHYNSIFLLTWLFNICVSIDRLKLQFLTFSSSCHVMWFLHPLICDILKQPGGKGSKNAILQVTVTYFLNDP